MLRQAHLGVYFHVKCSLLLQLHNSDCPDTLGAVQAQLRSEISQSKAASLDKVLPPASTLSDQQPALIQTLVAQSPAVAKTNLRRPALRPHPPNESQTTKRPCLVHGRAAAPLFEPMPTDPVDTTSGEESSLWAAMLTGTDDAMLDNVVSDSMIDVEGK